MMSFNWVPPDFCTARGHTRVTGAGGEANGIGAWAGMSTRADNLHGGQVLQEGGHQGVPARVQLVAVDADVELEPGGVGVVGCLPCREDHLGFTAADPAAQQPPPPQQQQHLVGMGSCTQALPGKSQHKAWLVAEAPGAGPLGS